MTVKLKSNWYVGPFSDIFHNLSHCWYTSVIKLSNDSPLFSVLFFLSPVITHITAKSYWSAFHTQNVLVWRLAYEPHSPLLLIRKQPSLYRRLNHGNISLLTGLDPVLACFGRITVHSMCNRRIENNGFTTESFFNTYSHKRNCWISIPCA